MSTIHFFVLLNQIIITANHFEIGIKENKTEKNNCCVTQNFYSRRLYAGTRAVDHMTYAMTSPNDLYIFPAVNEDDTRRTFAFPAYGTANIIYFSVSAR